MSCRIHGGRGERGELHGVRGGDVHDWHGLYSVLFVPRGQVCGDGRQCWLLNVPARLERVRAWERGVHLLRGVHRGRRRALYRMWGGDVQGRDWECSMCGVSFGFVREWCQLQCLHQLWEEHRIGGGEHCSERLWLRTGLLGGYRRRGNLHCVSYWDVQGLW